MINNKNRSKTEFSSAYSSYFKIRLDSHFVIF
jgi:hypothetical protein